ncbi:hypothetical protein CHS0354_032079 [Potamilus streckersoni]|uniref:Uncharacterized protein n=1 Tax=Potamilus streckersoni TaxID=2493646 RepID=A0AAE0WG92_9BIVA|nr:hypothetical protein CHS0354_032079 [Potamilus streckersoni]
MRTQSNGGSRRGFDDGSRRGFKNRYQRKDNQEIRYRQQTVKNSGKSYNKDFVKFNPKEQETDTGIRIMSTPQTTKIMKELENIYMEKWKKLRETIRKETAGHFLEKIYLQKSRS